MSIPSEPDDMALLQENQLGGSFHEPQAASRSVASLSTSYRRQKATMSSPPFQPYESFFLYPTRGDGWFSGCSSLIHVSSTNSEDKLVRYFCDGCRQLGYWMQELIACGDDPSPRDGYLLFHSLFQRIDEFIRLCLTTEMPNEHMILDCIPFDCSPASAKGAEPLADRYYLFTPMTSGLKFIRHKTNNKVADDAWTFNLSRVTMEIVTCWKEYSANVRRGQIPQAFEDIPTRLLDWAKALSAISSNTPDCLAAANIFISPTLRRLIEASDDATQLAGLGLSNHDAICGLGILVMIASVVLFWIPVTSPSARVVCAAVGSALCLGTAVTLLIATGTTRKLRSMVESLGAATMVPFLCSRDRNSSGPTASNTETPSDPKRPSDHEDYIVMGNSLIPISPTAVPQLQSVTIPKDLIARDVVILGVQTALGRPPTVSYWGKALAVATGFSAEDACFKQLNGLVVPHSFLKLDSAFHALSADDDNAPMELVVAVEFLVSEQCSRGSKVMASLTCCLSGGTRDSDGTCSFVLMGRLWSEEETVAASHIARHAAELLLQYRDEIAVASITGQLMSMRAIVERSIGRWEKMDGGQMKQYVHTAAIGSSGEGTSVDVEVDSGFRSEVYADASGMRRVVRAVADKLRGEALSSNGARLMINAELVTVIDGGHSGTQSVGLPKIVLTFRPGLGDSGSGKGFGAGAVEAVVAEVHSEKIHVFGAVVQATAPCITIVLPASFEHLAARLSNLDMQRLNSGMNSTSIFLQDEQILDEPDEVATPNSLSGKALHEIGIFAEVQVLVLEKDRAHRSQLLSAIRSVDPSCTPQTFSTENELIAAYNGIINMACVFFPEDSDREALKKVRALASGKTNTVLVLTRSTEHRPGEKRSIFMKKSVAEGGRVVSLDLPTNPGQIIRIINNTIHSIREIFRLIHEMKDDEYTKDHEIVGTGGQASVFRATQKSSGKVFALKVVDTRAEGAMREFKKESEIMVLLNRKLHPNIVRLESIGDNGLDKMTLVLQYCELGNFNKLLQILERSGGMEISLIAHFAKQLLSAVSCIHQCGIVHRDIKTLNLFLNGLGELKVGDFGISCYDTEADDAWKGTRAYRPPELAVSTSVALPQAGSQDKLAGSNGSTLAEPPPPAMNNSMLNVSINPTTNPAVSQMQAQRAKASDIWMCGICIFEFFGAKPNIPATWTEQLNFFRNPANTADSIISSTLPFFSEAGVPRHVFPPDAVDFLRGTIFFDFMQRKSADELLQHPFLRRASDVQLRRLIETISDHGPSVPATPLQFRRPSNVAVERPSFLNTSGFGCSTPSGRNERSFSANGSSSGQPPQQATSSLFQQAAPNMNPFAAPSMNPFAAPSQTLISALLSAQRDPASPSTRSAPSWHVHQAKNSDSLSPAGSTASSEDPDGDAAIIEQMPHGAFSGN